MENVKRKMLAITIIGIIMALYLMPAASASAGEMVNINTATKEVLVTLKYVGEKIADRIIEYRKVHPFEVAEDFMKVKGVGQKVFDANKNKIIVADG